MDGLKSRFRLPVFFLFLRNKLAYSLLDNIISFDIGSFTPNFQNSMILYFIQGPWDGVMVNKLD